MPKAPKKPCAHPTCPELIEKGQSYCTQHRKERNRQYKRDRQDKETQKIYTSTRWRKIREIKLKKNPLCQDCQDEGVIKVADVVDHITPIKQGGAVWSMDNLRSLCVRHHNIKTARE